MALRKIRIGAVPDGFQYEDGDYPKSISVETPITCSGTPVDANDLVKLQQVGKQISVANISNPAAELSAYDASYGKSIICYDGAEYTIYAGHPAAGANVPYRVNGNTGSWIAIGGKYILGDTNLHGSLEFTTRAYFVRNGDDLELQIGAANANFIVETDGGVLATFSDSDTKVIAAGIRVLDVTGSRLAKFDGSKNLEDLTPIAAPTDASTSHDVTGTDTVDQAALEAALDALGTKINEVIDKLETQDILT